MAENFSNPKKKANIHTSRSTEIPNKMNTNRLTSRLIIKMANIKDKKNSEGRRKTKIYTQGNLHNTINWYFSRIFAYQKRMA